MPQTTCTSTDDSDTTTLDWEDAGAAARLAAFRERSAALLRDVDALGRQCAAELAGIGPATTPHGRRRLTGNRYQ